MSGECSRLEHIIIARVSFEVAFVIYSVIPFCIGTDDAQS